MEIAEELDLLVPDHASPVGRGRPSFGATGAWDATAEPIAALRA